MTLPVTKEADTLTRRTTLFVQGPRSSGFDTEEEHREWLNENQLNQRKLFEIKIQLPKKVYWWKPPQVCRWQPWMESEEFLSLSPAMQNYNINYDRIIEEQRNKLFNAPPVKVNYTKPKILPDFPLSEKPPTIMSYYLIKDFIMPRIPDDYLFYSERLKKKAVKQLKQIAESKEQEKITQNEELKEPLGEEVNKIEQENDLEQIEFLINIQDYKIQSDDQPIVTKRPSITSTSNRKIIPPSTPPRFLFPKPPKKLRPLNILERASIMYNRKHSTDSFDENNLNLSEFISHLDKLRSRAQPLFYSDSEIARRMEVKIAKQRKQLEEEEEALGTKREFHLSASKRASDLYKVPRRSVAIEPTSMLWRKSANFKKKRTRSRLSTSSSVGSHVKTSSRGSSRKQSQMHIEPKPEPEKPKEELKLIPHTPGKWSSKEVHCIEFDSANNSISFKAGKFGIFAFYIDRYSNLPFKGWTIKPETDITQKVLLSIELQHTKIDFEVTSEGIKCGIYVKTKSFMSELVPVVKEYADLSDVKRVLKSYNIDIFPELDATHYISGACEKLEALEEHTFKAMAAFCLAHSFNSCLWNRLASYREILLQTKLLNPKFEQLEEKEILLTTRSAYYVHTTQSCIDEKCIFNQNPPKQSVSNRLTTFLIPKKTNQIITF